MTDPSATPPTPAPTTSAASGPRKPRKIFLLVGLVLAAGLGIGLFTSVGTKKDAGPPKAGGPVPSFSAPRLNGTGTVQVPSTGTPTVVVFFGKWCLECRTELPPLAAAVRRQEAAGGALAKVHVVGVDSEDTTSAGQSFVRSTGVGFPVAHDPDIAILSGDFYFEGDPNTVFVKADGTISAVVRGGISPATFTADEKKLIPSES
jgi:peroxiredoxin